MSSCEKTTGKCSVNSEKITIKNNKTTNISGWKTGAIHREDAYKVVNLEGLVLWAYGDVVTKTHVQPSCMLYSVTWIFPDIFLFLRTSYFDNLLLCSSHVKNKLWRKSRPNFPGRFPESMSENSCRSVTWSCFPIKLMFRLLHSDQQKHRIKDTHSFQWDQWIDQLKKKKSDHHNDFPPHTVTTVRVMSLLSPWSHWQDIQTWA